ncbi:MAG: hypothetical protein LBQ51_08340 [Desulfovibrio sp.]|jgi:hypothetical protein|nr:hypothetical protein [Desulfovibrio sp.]
MFTATAAYPGFAGDPVNVERIRVTRYSAEEVIKQFLSLYTCMNFETELADMGIGRLRFFMRRKALREFTALFIALWYLALQKSFPQDAANFFSIFRESAAMLNNGSREAAKLGPRVDAYMEQVQRKKDADFLPVAEYMARSLVLKTRDFARLRLKLSLRIRNLYMLIFDKLV